jgi:hypothetical protein
MRRHAVAKTPAPSLDLRKDVLAGLLGDPKTLPSKFLCDAEGSRLFERICDLPEYYVARTELALLKSAAREITEGFPQGAALVEFGSGASIKTRLVLDGASEFRLYVPIDISHDALATAARSIRETYPDPEVCFRYSETLHRAWSFQRQLRASEWSAPFQDPRSETLRLGRLSRSLIRLVISSDTDRHSSLASISRNQRQSSFQRTMTRKG